MMNQAHATLLGRWSVKTARKEKRHSQEDEANGSCMESMESRVEGSFRVPRKVSTRLM